LGRVDDETEQIDLANRLERRIHHAHVHPVQGTMNARRVDKHNLRDRIAVVADTENAVPGGLRLVGHDRELRADEAGQEGRFPRIRAPDKRHETGLHPVFSPAVAGAGSCRAIRTLWMRRFSTSSTSAVSSPISTRSPTTGTRPRWASR